MHTLAGSPAHVAALSLLAFYLRLHASLRGAEYVCARGNHLIMVASDASDISRTATSQH